MLILIFIPVFIYFIKINEDLGDDVHLYENISINELTGININDIISRNTSGKPDDIITNKNIDKVQTMSDKTKYLYTIDPSAWIYEEDLNFNNLLNFDVKTDLTGSKPKILIFHTHSQEAFIDSRPDAVEDTIVGMGAYLAELLVEKYNICVVHDVGKYDVVDGKEERGSSYERMEPSVKKILDKYPSIEVTIDLHRDGVGNDLHLVEEINGKTTAKLMFFNGITRENQNGSPKELPSLKNPYIEENLALSLKAQLTANELYPGLMRRIYIKPYRYSLHLKPKSMLVEAGANTNTVEEMKNAMEVLADILYFTLH